MKAALCNIAVNIIKILQLSVQFDPVGLLSEASRLRRFLTMATKT